MPDLAPSSLPLRPSPYDGTIQREPHRSKNLATYRPVGNWSARFYVWRLTVRRQITMLKSNNMRCNVSSTSWSRSIGSARFVSLSNLPVKCQCHLLLARRNRSSRL